MPAHISSFYNDGYKKVEFCNKCGQEFPFKSVECESESQEHYIYVERKIIFTKPAFISGCYRKNG